MKIEEFDVQAMVMIFRKKMEQFLKCILWHVEDL